MVNSEQFFSVSGNVNPEWIRSGVITERLEWREERALIHSRLWSHPPQQTECTSSFLHLRPIQAKIKTFITLFEKCKRIYGLKMMKSEFKKAGTLQLTGIRRIDGERSGYYGNLGSLKAGTRHHGEFSVMGTPSLQPFLKSYWLTPVKWLANCRKACKYDELETV